jgi:hypothetical protein
VGSEDGVLVIFAVVGVATGAAGVALDADGDPVNRRAKFLSGDSERVREFELLPFFAETELFKLGGVK